MTGLLPQIIDIGTRGARGDGLTDDSSAINAALQSVAAGGEVRFSAATYAIKHPLVIPQNKSITLRGAGRQTIIKAIPDFAGDAMLFLEYDGSSSSKSNGSVLADLSFDADRLVDRCVWLQEGKSWKIDNLYLRRFLATGLELGFDGGSGALFYDARLTNVDIDADSSVMSADRNDSPPYGLRLNGGSTDNKIERVSISYVRDVGILVESQHNMFSNCHVWGGVDYGIRVDTYGNVFSQMYLDTCRVAGFGLNSDHVLADQLMIFRNSGSVFGSADVVGVKVLKLFAREVSLTGVYCDLLSADLDESEGTIAGASILSGWVARGSMTRNVEKSRFYVGVASASQRFAGVGRAWLSLGTWSTDDDGVYPTGVSSTGSEATTNGGLETWTSATDVANWTESLSGTTTINEETTIVHGGSKAARMELDSLGSIAYITQALSASAGDWLYATAYGRGGDAGKKMRIDFTNTQWVTGRAGSVAADSWTPVVAVTRATGTPNVTVVRGVGSIAAGNLYFDDISVLLLDLPTALRVVAHPDEHQFVAAEIEASADNHHAGIVARLDHYETPANFVIAHIANGKIFLDKCVGGTYTNLITDDVDFVDGAAIALRWVNATTVQMFYNSIQIGYDEEITDAALTSGAGQYAGIFATSSGYRISSFALNDWVEEQ